MEVMSRAGFKTNEILAATPAVLAAAAASGLEIAEVANVVSNALKGMGLEASQAGKVADILALASSRTNSTIGSLGESLKNVAQTASMLNVPIENTVAAIASLQDVGLEASVAGSSFNTMLTKMAAPSAGMTKKMKKLGITFKDAKGNMLPLENVLQQLNKASKKVGGNFDKVAFLAELVGLRGAKAAMALGKLFETGKLKTLTKELQNAEGSAKKMADLRMDTVTGSLLLLTSAIDAVKVKAFDLQSGPLKKAIDRMTEWVGVNETLIASRIGEFLLSIINNFDKIVAGAKAIFKGVAAFMALSLALKGIAAILGIINLLMMANPIVLGIMAAVAAVALLSGALDPLLDIISDIGSGVAGAFGMLSRWFGGDDEEQTVPGGSNVRHGATGPQIISPQDRVARSIEEQRTTSTSEVTLKTEPGTSAEVTNGKLGRGIQLEPSGAFN
jgi:TP901 family phage tail tape measure protein